MENLYFPPPLEPPDNSYLSPHTLGSGFNDGREFQVSGFLRNTKTPKATHPARTVSHKGWNLQGESVSGLQTPGLTKVYNVFA